MWQCDMRGSKRDVRSPLSASCVALDPDCVFVCPIVPDADYFRAVDDVVDNRIGDGLSFSIACQPGGLR